MAPRHLLLLTVVCALWGLNAVAAAVALQFMTPVWLTTFRLTALGSPALTIRLPRRYWRPVAIYGIATFAIQFSLYYQGLRFGLPAGVSSVVAQTSVIWSLILSSLVLRERVGAAAWFGSLLSFGGIVLLCWPQAGVRIPLLAVTIGIVGALFGAIGWVVIRKAPGVSNVALNVWGSVAALPLVLPVAWLIEGDPSLQIGTAFRQPMFVAVFVFQALVASLICFPAWTRMVGRYGIARVAPFALLVPIFGVAAAALLLGEQWTARMLGALVIIIGGLAIVQLTPRRPPPPPEQPASYRPSSPGSARTR